MNQRLRSTINASDLDEAALAEKLGVDRKTVQRWITTGRTPHPRTAFQAAKLLGVPATWLWEALDRRGLATSAEIVAFYPHRSEVSGSLWLNLLQAAQEEIWIMAYASLFLPEENLAAVEVLRQKAETGVRVYYRPLLGAPGVQFHLHRTTLYNSIFRFDDDMLINQHIYGAYGYVAPILHVRRVPGGDLFETYARSFARIWEVSYPFESV